MPSGRLGQLTYPDQRIADDVRTFTFSTLSFVLMALNSSFTILAFSGVLWSISPLLFIVAVSYAACGSYLTIVLGRQLITLNYNQLDKEASFRSGLIHVRENAESIMLAHRERRHAIGLMDRLDDLVVLFGECPGLTLEGIECQGFKHSAVNILHCTGTADRPVAITALRATTANKTEAALLFNHRESITKPLGNDHIRVADCIFVGPFSAAVELIGPERNLEFRSNRFFGAENGFLYKPSKAANPLQMTIASNTLCKLQTGLALESLPQLINSIQNSRVSLDKNLFAQTPIIARVVASPEEQAKSGETVQTLTRQLIQSSGNVRDPSSQEGNVIINAFAVVFPPLPQDTNELQRFLRYPKASPLTQHGSPGVPPVE